MHTLYSVCLLVSAPYHSLGLLCRSHSVYLLTTLDLSKTVGFNLKNISHKAHNPKMWFQGSFSKFQGGSKSRKIDSGLFFSKKNSPSQKLSEKMTWITWISWIQTDTPWSLLFPLPSRPFIHPLIDCLRWENCSHHVWRCWWWESYPVGHFVFDKDTENSRIARYTASARMYIRTDMHTYRQTYTQDAHTDIYKLVFDTSDPHWLTIIV